MDSARSRASSNDNSLVGVEIANDLGRTLLGDKPGMENVYMFFLCLVVSTQNTTKRLHDSNAFRGKRLFVGNLREKLGRLTGLTFAIERR